MVIKMKKLYSQIAKLGAQYGAAKVVLYGSRARGDHRERSDIDLAVFGMKEAQQAAFREAIGQLPTLLDFDLVFITERTSPALLQNIQKDGKVLMSKFSEKYEKFQNALARLCESVNDYKNFSNSTMRDGVIQRFEICTELAWKTAREYLLDQGYTEVNSPKSVMRRAYADGLLADEAGWLALLDARNITSHIYDDAEAADVFKKIENKFIPLFQALADKLK